MRNVLIDTSLFGLVASSALAARKPELGTFGFDQAGLDKAIKPGDDFVAYTRGNYLKTLEIPADRSEYGMFTQLGDLSKERTRSIIENAAKQPAALGSNAQKVDDFYARFMDEAGIEAKRLAPMRAELEAIAGVQDKAALARLIGDTARENVTSPINSLVEQDLKNPGVMAPMWGKAGWACRTVTILLMKPIHALTRREPSTNRSSPKCSPWPASTTPPPAPPPSMTWK